MGRFCARWSSAPDRDTDGMPPVGSPLDVWAAWYRACRCELCRSVAGELAGRPVYRSVLAGASW